MDRYPRQRLARVALRSLPYRALAGAVTAWLLCLCPTSAQSPRPPWVGSRFSGSPLPPPPYSTERAFPQARFREATDFAFVPGTRQLFVSQQDGKLFAFDTGRLEAPVRLALDLRSVRSRVDSVLGFTFHPGFATNRFVYINYNGPESFTNAAVVARFTVSSIDPPVIDPTTERILVRWPSGGHNGCTLAFGPDGMLYISTGDAAAPDPPDGRFKTGQDLGDLLGAILRIDVDVVDESLPYRVPPDNPFLAVPGARPEIWAFGFRNPFRMSFGPDGTLWATDVGWEQWEMIYRIRRGGNYGWPITEGPNLRVRDDILPGPGPILPPLHAISHTDGASISGGQVYRSGRLPELRGAYVYGDWETGRLWALRSDGDRLTENVELCDTSLKPVSFANDPDGDVLVLDYHDGVHRLVRHTAPAVNLTFPRRLSESGLSRSLRPLQPADGVVPYSIRSPMWNDHAKAEWWLAIPGSGSLATTGGVGNIAGTTWYFPSNTVLARTLSLDFIEGNEGSRRPVETQILHWDGQGWNPHTYQWNSEATDADLVGPMGSNVVFEIADPSSPGGLRRTPWRFMSRGECLRCHNAWAGEAVTLNPLQLGSSTTNLPSSPPRPDSASSEFERLVRLGAVRGRLPTQPHSPGLVDPADSSAPLEARARSWLHANCASCHRFGAGGAAALRLAADSPLDELRVIDVRPTRGDFGLADARIVAPADPWRSTLLFRIATEGAGHMPHIGARLVDEAGLALVRDWIRSLPVPSNPISAPDRTSWARRRDAIRADLGSPNRVDETRSLLADSSGALAAVVEPGREHRLAPIRAAATSHPLPLVRDLFQRFLPPDRRRVTLGTEIHPDSILSLSGEPTRGKSLFDGAAQCSRCHVRDGIGRAFGPELAKLASRYDRPRLLEQILSPSSTVAPEFRTVIVTLRDGSEVTGFVLRRDDESIVLREESLAERALKRTEFVELRESALSAMPEGLLAPLTAQEAADLLAYLGAD